MSHLSVNLQESWYSKNSESLRERAVDPGLSSTGSMYEEDGTHHSAHLNIGSPSTQVVHSAIGCCNQKVAKYHKWYHSFTLSLPTIYASHLE